MKIRMLFFPLNYSRMSPLSQRFDFGFCMVLTLKGRRKSFCFQPIKTYVKAEDPSACQCRYMSILVVWRKLLGEFKELLCEIKINKNVQYERPLWRLVSAHTVLWSVIDVSGSGRHISTYVFLLVLHWVRGSFAFPYSQVDVDIIKFNHDSIVGSNSRKKVTFVSISIEFQITEALESITRLS